jgi:site-specific recombinase XerD
MANLAVRAIEAFDAWAQGEIARENLNAKSVQKYRPLWSTWAQWCAQRGTSWDDVQAADLQAFLEGPPQGRKTHRPALDARKMGAFSRMRYYQLFKGVYTLASKRQWTCSNLALDLPQASRPSLGARDSLSQVLEPAVFRELCRSANLERIFAPKTPADWWHARDRAIVATLAGAGLTVQELINLRGCDVLEAHGRKPLSPYQQLSLFESAQTDLLIDVMANVQGVQRTVPLDGNFAQLLRDWMTRRYRVLSERASAAARGRRRTQYLQQHSHLGPLFMARKAPQHKQPLGPMAPNSVYVVASHALQQLRQLHDLSTGEIVVAKGPAIIRNTVVQQWIATRGAQEAAAFAGLKDMYSLRLPVSGRG